MLTVHVEPDTLAIASSGLVTGVLSLRGEDASFPDDGWNDAPVVVLGWWLEALAPLQAGGTATVRCQFMEGPFFFEVSLHGEELVLRCQQRKHSSTHVVLEGRVLSDVFMRRLVEAAAQVIAACERRGWTSGDLSRLKALVEGARAQMSRSR